MTGSRSVLLSGAASAAILLMLTSVAAEAETVDSGLQEIIVTPRKRTEKLQDVPVTISVVSAEKLQNFGITNLEKLAATEPGMTIVRGNSGSGGSIYMRGVGSAFTSIGIEQSVAVLVDDAYYGQGRIINEGLFDASGIEVLKGPQALFFGKNATAGVISIKTNDPTNKFEIMGRINYETTAETLGGEAIASGPITDTLGIRLAWSGTHMMGGYLKALDTGRQIYPTLDVATGTLSNHTSPAATTEFPHERDMMGRLTLKWTPTADFNATLKVSANTDRTSSPSGNIVPDKCPAGNGFSTLAAGSGIVQPCGTGFVTFQSALPADIAATLPYGNKHGGQLFNNYDSYGITLGLNYNLGWATLSSVTNAQGYHYTALGDYDFTAVPAIWADEDDRYHAISEEARIITNFDGPLNYTLGALYQSTKLNFAQNVIAFNLSNSAASAANNYLLYSKRSATDGETEAVFGQVNWHFMPDWELAAGARYTRETKNSYFLQPYVNPALTGLFVPGTTINSDQVFHNLSPDFSLTWKPTSNLRLYANYKVGYKSGGFSNSAILSAAAPNAGPFSFRPETVKGMEMGLKATLLNNHLRLNLDGYHYRFSNFQVDYFNSAQFAYITYNAGALTTDGAELEAEYAVAQVPGLTLTGSLNYNDAHYVAFIGPCYAGQTIAAGCGAAGVPVGPGGAPQQNLAGRPTANAPRWTGYFGIGYETAITNRLTLGLSTDIRYSDSYAVSYFDNPLEIQPSYVNFDVAVRVSTSDNHWQLALIGRNLSDNYVRTYAGDLPSTGGGTGTANGTLADQGVALANPRTIMMQLTYRY